MLYLSDKVLKVGLNSTPKLVKSPLNPINKPVATNTGIIGTKISPKVRDIFCGKVISLYASSFTFPVSTPSPFIAAKTLFTNPVPKII